MNALKKLIASLLFALISTSAFAITDNQVFAYAEANYPSLFTGTATSGQYLQYNYRYYPASENYLAVDTSGIISILGPYTGGVVTPVGLVTAFADTITAWEATQAGTAVTTFATGLSNPTQITADLKGNLFVTNFNNSTVSKITSAGVVSTFASNIRGTGIVADGSDNLYVSDYTSNSVKKITPSGTISTLVSGISQPQGITIDSNNNLYVSEWAGGTIKKVTPAGVVSSFATGFYGPSGMTIDSAGNIYVADTYNNAIRKVTPQGVVTTVAGELTTTGSTDGAGTSARFNRPFGIAIDAANNLYVTDSDNFTIRKISSTGAVTTVAGLAGSSGSTNGTGSQARFNAPRGPYIDTAGNLYVADSLNNIIRKIPPGAMASGTGTTGGTTTGGATGSTTTAVTTNPNGGTVPSVIGGMVGTFPATIKTSTMSPFVPGAATLTIASGGVITLNQSSNALSFNCVNSGSGQSTRLCNAYGSAGFISNEMIATGISSTVLLTGTGTSRTVNSSSSISKFSLTTGATQDITFQ